MSRTSEFLFRSISKLPTEYGKSMFLAYLMDLATSDSCVERLGRPGVLGGEPLFIRLRQGSGKDVHA